MTCSTKRHNKLLLPVLLTIILIVGCNSVKFIFCGNNVCNPGEEETCPKDCKKEIVESKTVDDILSEGQTTTYEFNNKKYEAKVLIISDIISQAGVKLNINGQFTPLLKVGDIYTINGVKIEIKDIIVNKVGDPINDIVEFKLGEDIHDFLEEGGSKIYTANEKDYFIKSVIIDEAIDPDAIVKFIVNEKPISSLKAGKSYVMEGLKLEVNEIIPNKANDTIPDLVEFTLNNKKQDILEESEIKSYNLDGKEHTVQVLAIGDSGNIDSSVKIEVDDISIGTLYAGNTHTLEGGAILRIKDIIPNEFEENKGSLIEFSLNDQFTAIINDSYIPKYFNLGHTNYKIRAFDVNKREKVLTESVPSVKFLINNKLSERLYEGQDFMPDKLCNIKVKEIHIPKIDNAEKDRVDLSFSCV
jgi:uncharacterized protein YxeA|tara:strand:+ start:1047 stop:2288 length:1242 start_codon:yes stop_codon:yes gene_type:complete